MLKLEVRACKLRVSSFSDCESLDAGVRIKLVVN